MPVMMLDWGQAATLAAVLVALGTALAFTPWPRARALAPFARETAIIAGLYAVWQLAGSISVLGMRGALARGEWIVRTERRLHFPSEVTVQRLLTSNDVLANIADWYYATMHFTIMGVFLVWLFVRHRDRYRPVRRVLALATLMALLVSLIPVAPPRLLPVSYGFVDTAVLHGSSVYGLGIDPDVVSAMPSVHVLWAGLVGFTVLRLGSGWGRVLGPLHFVVTVLVVVATANHTWSDGLVALALLGLATLLVSVTTRILTPIADRVRARWRPAVDSVLLPLGSPPAAATVASPSLPEPSLSGTSLPGASAG